MSLSSTKFPVLGNEDALKHPIYSEFPGQQKSPKQAEVSEMQEILQDTVFCVPIIYLKLLRITCCVSSTDFAPILRRWVVTGSVSRHGALTAA